MSGTYWQCAECDLVYTHSDGLGVTERFEPKVCMECRDDEDDPVPLYPVDVVKGGTVAALRAEAKEIERAWLAGRWPLGIEPPEAGKRIAALVVQRDELVKALRELLHGNEIGEVLCQLEGFPRLTERWEHARAALARAEKGEP